MKRIQTLLFVFFSGFVFCQQPVLEWAKTFGGSGYDLTGGIVITKENESIIVGSTGSIDYDLIGNTGGKAWIIKVNQYGEKVFSRTYGGSRAESGVAIVQSIDGNFIIGGNATSNDKDVPKNQGKSDAWIFKVDKQGNLLWSKTYGGSNNELISGIFETTNGDIIVGLSSNSNDGDFSENKGSDDWWILKINKQGDLVWKKRIGGNQPDLLYKLVNIDDKTFVVVGSYSSKDGEVTNTKSDAVVKMDSTGRLVWSKSFGSPKDSSWLVNNLRSVSVSLDKQNIIAVGESYNFSNQSTDILIYKIDTSGNLKWNKLYGGSNIENVSKIEILKNGSVLCLGDTYSNDFNVSYNYGLSDMWLFMLDSEGNLKWEKSYGGSKGDFGTDFAITSDNKIVIVGSTGSNDGIFQNNYGNKDFAITQVKYDFSSSIENVSNLLNVKIFPNPLDNVLNIQVDDEVIEDINLSDLNGRVIKHNKIETHSQRIEINCTDLSIGTYILKIKTVNNMITHKIIVMR
jgi:Secretion system C-terminal sorting domain